MKVVRKLHYEFDRWLGDELLESSGCYIATERSAHEIVRANLKGVEFDSVKVSTSGEFEDLHPGICLTKFIWLKVAGFPGKDDFGLLNRIRLVVSERAIELLKRIGFAHAISFAPYGDCGVSEVVPLLTFDEERLRKQIEKLPPRSCSLFAICCAQRLAGVIERWEQSHNSCPLAAPYRQAMTYVWTHIIEKPDKDTTTQLLGEVMAMIPDDDGANWTCLTPLVDDALSALAYSLRCLESNSPVEAAWVARRVYEALDCFVSNRDNIDFAGAGAESRILGDPAIQQELERQARDLREIKSAGERLTKEFVDMLLRRGISEQVSPLQDQRE